MQEPQPQLAELLRTCVHPPSLLLRIVYLELLDVDPCPDETETLLNAETTSQPEVKRRYGIKFILSDGEIMMQALLHRKLLRDTADVVVGDLLDIRRCAVKKSPRLDGHGHVVYLAIEDCHFLQQVRSIGRTSIEEEDVRPTTFTRKRKRTMSLSEVNLARGGAISHARMQPAPDGFLEPLLDERSTPPKTPEHKLSRVNKDMINAPEVASLPQAAHNQVDNLQPLSNSATVVPAGEHYESRATMSTKDKSCERDRSNTLKNTFGARQIMSDDDDDDFFEALSTNQTTVKQRRRALQKLDGNTSFSSPTSTGMEKPESDGIEALTPFKPTPVPNDPPPVANLPQILPPYPPVARKSVRDGTFALSQAPRFYLPPPPLTTIKPARPPPPPPPPPLRKVQTQPNPQPLTQPALLPSPPFHTLSFLRNPASSQNLPSKSYTLTTMAIISWTGTTTIHRPGSLFPPKRHLKVVDPTLSASRPPSRQAQPQLSAVDQQNSSFKAQNSFQNAVTVAVYIDAANFKPAAGTIVLFRGLVMQRLVNGDIILNAYGRLKEQRFEETNDDKDEGRVSGVEEREKTSEGDNNQASDADQTQFNTHWFITDHSKIRNLGHGSRLDYYIDWWAERQRAQQEP